jgi:hypothetical protein
MGMISDSQPLSAHTDHNAAISFAAGMLTLIAVCLAVVPIPFTGYICFPAAAILTPISAAHGLRALHRYGSLKSTERGMAVVGLTAAGLAVLIAACSGFVVIILGVRLMEATGQLFR